MSLITTEALVSYYNMKPHPEGGFFVETFRSLQHCQVQGKEHACGSTILYLLPSGRQDSLHRLKSDETWSFYLGQSLQLWTISPTGQVSCIRLGSNPLNQELLQYTVPAGYWFGAECTKGSSPFALVGCIVFPAFEWEEFELATTETLKDLVSPDDFETLKRFIKSS